MGSSSNSDTKTWTPSTSAIVFPYGIAGRDGLPVIVRSHPRLLLQAPPSLRRSGARRLLIRRQLLRLAQQASRSRLLGALALVMSHHEPPSKSTNATERGPWCPATTGALCGRPVARRPALEVIPHLPAGPAGPRCRSKLATSGRIVYDLEPPAGQPNDVLANDRSQSRSRRTVCLKQRPSATASVAHVSDTRLAPRPPSTSPQPLEAHCRELRRSLIGIGTESPQYPASCGSSRRPEHHRAARWAPVGEAACEGMARPYVAVRKKPARRQLAASCAAGTASASAG